MMFIIKEADLIGMKEELLAEIRKDQELREPKRFMKSSKVRELLGGISAAKLQSLRVGGHIPAINADGMWIYDYNDVIDFLTKNKINVKEVVRDE